MVEVLRALERESRMLQLDGSRLQKLLRRKIRFAAPTSMATGRSLQRMRRPPDPISSINAAVNFIFKRMGRVRKTGEILEAIK